MDFTNGLEVCVIDIKAIRAGTGLTQEQFAAAIGVSKGHMSKVENGLVPLSQKIIRKLQLSQNIIQKLQQVDTSPPIPVHNIPMRGRYG